MTADSLLIAATVVGLILTIIGATYVLGERMGSLKNALENLAKKDDELGKWLNDVSGTVQRHDRELAALQSNHNQQHPGNQVAIGVSA